jgi:predicted secreted protein
MQTDVLLKLKAGNDFKTVAGVRLTTMVLGTVGVVIEGSGVLLDDNILDKLSVIFKNNEHNMWEIVYLDNWRVNGLFEVVNLIVDNSNKESFTIRMESVGDYMMSIDTDR